MPKYLTKLLQRLFKTSSYYRTFNPQQKQQCSHSLSCFFFNSALESPSILDKAGTSEISINRPGKESSSSFSLWSSSSTIALSLWKVEIEVVRVGEGMVKGRIDVRIGVVLVGMVGAGNVIIGADSVDIGGREV